MVLDANDATASNFGSTTNANRFLRNTLSHEHGHGLGLSHVCPIANSKLMEPFLATGFDSVRQDDARAGMYNYGDSSEPNNTSATATVVNSLARGAATVTLGTAPAPLAGTSDANASTLSINSASDVDFFKITPTESLLFNATVTPKGSTYTQGPQTSACNTGTSINTLSQDNLAVQVQDAAGNVLAEASGNAAGSAESLSNVFLTGGTSLVPAVRRIFATRFGDRTVEGSQRGFAGKGGKIGTDIAMTVSRDQIQIHIPRQGGMAQMDIQDLAPLCRRRRTEIDLAIKPTGPAQSRIPTIWQVGRGHHDHPTAFRHSIHQRQKLRHDTSFDLLFP
jgi:hypothetical protein